MRIIIGVGLLVFFVLSCRPDLHSFKVGHRAGIAVSVKL